MDYTYRAFGLTLRSCLPLPAADASGGTTPEVTIRYGAVGPELAGAVWRRGRSQASPRTVHLSIEGIARYLVANGDDIVIDRQARASDDDVRLFLLGSALGALLHQRGDLVLHGSAIDAGGAAVGFLGPSGSGKSTLAAAFARRGYGVLTDDLCVVRPDARGVMHAQPGLSQIKLWRDTLDHLDIPAAPLARVGAGLDKRALPVVTTRAVPLERLYVLHPDATDRVDVAGLEGSRKFQALLDHTYRPGYLEGLGTRAAHFQQVVAMARATAIAGIRRPSDSFCVDRVLDRLIADFAVETPGPSPLPAPHRP